MNNKIIYVPLEHIDSRYTSHLDRDIVDHLESRAIPYVRIYPDVKASRALPAGMFLDAPFTTRFKSLQLAALAEMFETGKIATGDVIFFSDIWFPGIESIAYMSHFTGIKPKIRGILHAGSFTDTDEVRQFERWAKNFEDIVFDIADTIFVASEFIRRDVLRKRVIHPDKLVVTPLPLDVKEMQSYTHMHPYQDRPPVVIFNGRNHPEKQPHLWERLKVDLVKRWNRDNPTESCPFVFKWTLQENMPKDRYYALMARSKVVVSFALQENFGYGIAEAAYLGCVPVVPNKLVYPELYSSLCCYETYDDAVDKVYDLLVDDKLTDTGWVFKSPGMKATGNLDSISRWFIK